MKKEPEDEGSKSKVDIPIDFAALKEKNPDVYAWISISKNKHSNKKQVACKSEI